MSIDTSGEGAFFGSLFNPKIIFNLVIPFCTHQPAQVIGPGVIIAKLVFIIRVTHRHESAGRKSGSSGDLWFTDREPFDHAKGKVRVTFRLGLGMLQIAT